VDVLGFPLSETQTLWLKLLNRLRKKKEAKVQFLAMQAIV
jgi:hypothetical protein